MEESLICRPRDLRRGGTPGDGEDLLTLGSCERINTHYIADPKQLSSVRLTDLLPAFLNFAHRLAGVKHDFHVSKFAARSRQARGWCLKGLEGLERGK